jgi:alanyl-tRNA synthetase
MQGINDIRSAFLNFFKEKNHEVVPSSPLIPHNDPTLLFTSAGMVPFKDVFTGVEKRPYSRAASSQKCLRAGGKHNDLESVGYTARHHTFFEMLGNFSFGDYFKEEAIYYAWELVTQQFELPRDRLLVTVYSEDIEAAALWKKIAGFSDNRIISISTSDNFWSMGESGPCGPCTEIFYDHGETIAGGPPGSPNQDGDRFMEIWNLVFMQYEQVKGGQRIPLPKPSVDTGMGLERITTVLQGVHSTFDTDLFQSLIAASMDLTGANSPGQRHSHHIIADHLRACAFLLADGILPGNEGRGYVLRRIMRRAMRHAHILGAADPLMDRLVPTLIGLMGGAFPELVHAESVITENLRLEEEKFRQTLERGLRLLNEASASLAPGQALSGEVAFKLYDTFGFPLDLTEDVLKESGRCVDTLGFEKAMDVQKTAARKAWVGSGELKTDPLWLALHQEFGATDFVGYDALKAQGTIQAILIEGAHVTEAGAGEAILFLANQTPFYAESGGQEGDHGKAVSNSGAEMDITDTTRKGGSLHIHAAQVVKGVFKTGDVLKFAVDGSRRLALRANHSATHLLHAALRQLLGNHVAQKGSLVAAQRLRFDFTHPRPITRDEIFAIERLVNEHIMRNHEVQTHLTTQEEAVKQGALALFGERYGDKVRVLSMGQLNMTDEYLEARPFSVELCGGTHVRHTGDIGLFKITGESGVSAGIRRIEALTGLAALDYVNERDSILVQAGVLLKSTPVEMPDRLQALLTERKNLHQQVAPSRQDRVGITAENQAPSLSKEIMEKVNGFQLMVRHLENAPLKDIKFFVDDLKKQVQSGIIVITNKTEDKTALVVGVTPDIIGQISAVEIIQACTEALNGNRGGGRPDLAQAGGSNVDIEKVMTVIKIFLTAKR